MMTVKSQFIQQTFAVMTLFLVLGALAMLWPAIIALILGVFLLFHSLGVEQEIVLLSWTEVSNVSIVFASLRRPGFLAIPS